MAVIIAAAVAIVAVGDTEDAFDRADGAADTGSDDTADGAAHGTGNPVTFIGTFLGAPYNSLGLSCLRHRQPCEQDGGRGKKHTGRTAGRDGQGGIAGFDHLGSPKI